MDDKARSRLYFDKHSSTRVNKNGYWSFDYRTTVRLIREQGIRVHLDVGCGNGAFLACLSETDPSIRLWGLDYSPEMVARSQERLPEAEIREGDAEQMPLEEGSFEGVSCHMSIHHYPHPERALQEMYRVLEEGGLVLINDLTGPTWLRRLMNWSFQYWNTGDHAVYGRCQMEEMLRKAGFEKVRSLLPTPFTYVCLGVKPMKRA